MIRNLTKENIDNFLGQYGVEWLDHQVYDIKQKKYMEVSPSYLKKKYLYLVLKNEVGKNYVMRAEITEDKFILSKEGNAQINLSANWKEFISQISAQQKVCN